jgi:hypothetical protein
MADEQIIQYCSVLEKLDILKSPRNATPGNLMGGDSGQIFSPILQPAGGLGIDAADHIEDRGFSCAIRANQGEHFTRINIETHVIDCEQSAELTGDVLGAKQGLCHGSWAT